MSLVLPHANLLVTGGAGFIGSAFVRYLLRLPSFRGRIITLDRLSYAANLANLRGFFTHPRHLFVQGSIANSDLVQRLLLEKEVDAIVHFAAETHVDRSIAQAAPFIEHNVQGTLALLEAARMHSVHFHHISTDEVYGSLGESGTFSERSPYRPSSPYSASKAASDHLVRAFYHTYQLPVTLSHCSNNYGPGQHPEKLIPLVIERCLARQPIPIYGRGSNVRDWVFVEDHVEAIWTILQKGKRGETYNIGGGVEKSNLEIVFQVLKVISEYLSVDRSEFEALIQFVADRPGHDFRYAIDGSKIEKELQWRPKISLEDGLRRTVRWYLKNRAPFGVSP